ncbi:hypothetical protein MTIM_32100 [Mycobacterium timonense]|uniref:Uncharacterized protein n=1 Tax=Mycobacterium timonense TaxID=701043 RepID=A0A7I9Z8N9_9MYCO|nr:hypothetical protein MTIM_32100 [Mycobacterium timonense]
MVPEVYTMWAMSAPVGGGNPASGWAAMWGSATSITVSAWPSNRDASSAVVTTATGAASPSTNSMRASGTAGSIGRYAAPDLSTAKIAMIASADRPNISATDCPAPAP